MSHLEDLLAEYYEWSGYVVRRNVKVGKLAHGGWEGELDIVAYHPQTKHLIHLEPSIDAHSWERREKRFARKFKSGRKYMFTEVLPWLEPDTPIEHVAILPSRGKDRSEIGGRKLMTIDELVRDIRRKVIASGRMASNAIPEQFPLLRTIQLTHVGYQKAIGGTAPAD